MIDTSTAGLLAEQEKLWDARAARAYDADDDVMFSADVLDATTAFLADAAAGGRALELAIGTGRVAIPLVERGVDVTGIELSRPMIARLREKVDAASIEVVHGSMTDTRAPGEFSLVYLVFNTLGNVCDQAGQVDVFRNAAAHLRPGGRFVVEMGVPQLQRIPVGGDAFVFGHSDGYVGIDYYDLSQQLLVSHHLRWTADGEATHVETPQRYVWPSEMDLMGQLAGFSLEHRYADWDRSEFTGATSSHVSVYRRLL